MSLADTLDVAGALRRLGPNDEALTGEATLIGTVEAATLLGPDHPGSLLSAQGPSVGPGDSGQWRQPRVERAPDRGRGLCPIEREPGDEVLMGVMQDANAERQSTLPFGLTPLYPFEHAAGWRRSSTTAARCPSPQPERPRLDP